MDQEQTFSKFVYSMCVLIERSVWQDYRFALHSVIKSIRDDLASMSTKDQLVEDCESILADETINQTEMRLMCFKLLAELIIRYRHRFSNAHYVALLNAFI